jgi:hypothetical protein
MVVSDGERRVGLCMADLVRLPAEVVAETRRLVERDCGLSPEDLILSTAHVHTAPDVDKEEAYSADLPRLLAQALRRALDDESPCDLAVGQAEEPTLPFIRRYRMKDGSVRTNPGILNPDVVEPIGEPDPALQVLLGSQGDQARGGLVHYALHCDTVGGTEVSADWTFYLRRAMQAELGEEFLLLSPIGPAGDVNHWNVFRETSLRGFAEAERIGSILAGAALSACEHVESVSTGHVVGLQRQIEVKTRYPSRAELARARRMLAEAPPADVDFTMERVEAMRRLKAAEAGPTVALDITVLAFGNVALVGLPCELFTELGRRIKAESPFDHTLVVTLANGDIGYVGTRRDYEEGGYEMTSSIAAPGTDEQIVGEAVALLKEVHLLAGET